jgi:GT2 family glycosyltransferase
MLPVSIVIPTYRRETVMLQSVQALLALSRPAAELLLVDQTPRHEPETEAALESLSAAGRIRWLRLAEPSITGAMNAGLLAATQDCVLFLDDDIVPEPALVESHYAAHVDKPGTLIAGRVLQPWDEGRHHSPDAPFHFAHPLAQWARDFAGGNFSVPRDAAIAIGGFDENFVNVAFRYEAEFAHRWRESAHRIYFEPSACLHHLKADAGGTRTFGHHLTTWRGDHAVGAYYWALRTGSWREFVLRPWRAVATRFHLRRPWRIPPTVIAELAGMLWAMRLHRSGPKRISRRARNS